MEAQVHTMDVTGCSSPAIPAVIDVPQCAIVDGAEARGGEDEKNIVYICLRFGPPFPTPENR